MTMLAHITTVDHERREQTLKRHCLSTALYAGRAVEGIGLFHTAYLAGLLHDMGKATSLFQTYLEDGYLGKERKRGSVNHTFAGVIYCMERYHKGERDAIKRLTAELVAYAAGAHHGLFDCIDLDGRNGFVYRLQKDRKEIAYEEARDNFLSMAATQAEIDKAFLAAAEEISDLFARIKRDWAKRGTVAMFQLGLLARLLVAAVVEGDRADTREFMSGKKEEKQTADRDFWKEQLCYFEQKAQRFPCDHAIDQVRQYISESCREAAEKKEGIYRLHVPTGSGKTLSSLRYALRHAELYEKKRIIFLIPLLSVLEQNVAVIREYIGDQSVILEHHSNLLQEGDCPDETDRLELLKESWSAPVVVSTLVQFLDILFTHRTSAVRRMHALTDSVIVMDEVQSVPKKMWNLFTNALNFLTRYCRCTVILCSATQPCFESVKTPLLFADRPELVELSEEQRQTFHRAEIIDRTTPYGMTIEELADFCRDLLEESSSLLVVCNTKAEAAKLYEMISACIGCQDTGFFHLSTAMCTSHRKSVLEKIVSGLSEIQGGSCQRKCACISTQLIEAGIDVSFETVVRINAGIDNVAQAAGRCNRNNEYGRLCKTYIVNLKNEQLQHLHDIKSAQISTQSVLLKHKTGSYRYEGILSDEAVRDFYNDLLQQKMGGDDMDYPLQTEGISYTLAELLSYNKGRRDRSDMGNAYVMGQSFLEAGRQFHVFDENTTDILVPYQEGREIMTNLCSERAKWDERYVEEQLERAKEYTISIFEYQKKALMQSSLLHQEGNVFMLDEAAYDDEALGLVMEGKEENILLL